jgi:hypothetical protein
MCSSRKAGRTTEDEQLSFADLAGEEPSNGASNRLEKQEKDDDANDALDQANTRRSWFPSSLGLSFILEKGATLEATVTWGDYGAPADGAEEKLWCRTPQRQTITFPIAGPGTSQDIPLEPTPKGLCLRWIARPAPSKLGYPSDQLSVSLFLLNKREPPQTKQIRHRDPVTAFQAELSLRCERGFPPRRDALQQAAKDPDERLAALQYRRDYCFASGHNVAVIASDIPEANPARCHSLTTTWLPTARVNRTLPEPPAGINVPMGMEALADHAQSERVCQQLLPMVAAYRGWITQQPKHPISDQEQNETAKQLRAQAEDCAKRIENGIKLLADPPGARSLSHHEPGDGPCPAPAQCLQRQGAASSDRHRPGQPQPQLALLPAGLRVDEPAGLGGCRYPRWPAGSGGRGAVVLSNRWWQNRGLSRPGGLHPGASPPAEPRD